MIQLRTGKTALTLTLPVWLTAPDGPAADDEARVRFVLDLARRCVQEGGGPFAAAIFEADGRLLAAGANLVVPGASSVLHAEVVAILAAQSRVGHYSLRTGGARQMVASCDPCAMCLGAIHWSGIERLVTCASTDDARAAGFDEGPVGDASFAYLLNHGMNVRRGVLAEEGARALREYAAAGGAIYNG